MICKYFSGKINPKLIIGNFLCLNEFNTFLNMLVKTRSKFDESTKINEELFLLTKELEKNYIKNTYHIIDDWK